MKLICGAEVAMLRAPALLMSAVLLSLAVEASRGAAPVLNNGDFSQWTDGMPDGWEVSIGARNGGDKPISELTVVKGPALLLRGDRSTMAWRAVSQLLTVQPGQQCVLEFEAAAKNVRREGNQFDNCYVGIISLGADGQSVGQRIQDLSAPRDGWAKHQLQFVVPSNADATKVMIFLSKTGMLGVRNVKLTVTGSPAAPPSGSATDDRLEAVSLVKNSRFLQWSRGRPEDWTIEIGAKNGGDMPTSVIEQVEQGGVTLRGDRSTMAWYSLSQDLGLQPGRMYTLTFEARGDQIRREQGQFDNCYVGVMCLDDQGQRLEMAVKDLSRVTRLQPQRVNFRVPDETATSKLLIFLSKTGALTVKSVGVKEATPERPFRGAGR